MKTLLWTICAVLAFSLLARAQDKSNLIPGSPEAIAEADRICDEESARVAAFNQQLGAIADQMQSNSAQIQRLTWQMQALNVAISYYNCENNWHPFWHRIYWQEADGRHYITLPEPWEPFLRWTHPDPCKRAMRQGGVCNWQLDSKDWAKAQRKLGCPANNKNLATR